MASIAEGRDDVGSYNPLITPSDLQSRSIRFRICTPLLLTTLVDWESWINFDMTNFNKTDTKEDVAVTSQTSIRFSVVSRRRVVVIDQHPKSRIPSNSGYGDLCFGRWANHPGNWTSRVTTTWEKDSNAAVVTELGGFKR
jgi:hypothetical protein